MHLVERLRTKMSTMVGDILNYKKSDKEDYYAILGCDEHSSVSFNLRKIYHDISLTNRNVCIDARP